MSRDPTRNGSEKLKPIKHEKVAQLYIQKNKKDYECYKDVYNCKLETAKVNMSKLLTNANFKDRIDFLNNKHVEKALWNREMAVEALREAMMICKEDRTMAPLISAVKELNTLEDLYPKEKKEIDLKVSSSDVFGKLKEAILNE